MIGGKGQRLIEARTSFWKVFYSEVQHFTLPPRWEPQGPLKAAGTLHQNAVEATGSLQLFLASSKSKRPVLSLEKDTEPPRLWASCLEPSQEILCQTPLGRRSERQNKKESAHEQNMSLRMVLPQAESASTWWACECDLLQIGSLGHLMPYRSFFDGYWIVE